MKTWRVLLAVSVVFASFAFVPVPKSVEAVVGWVGAGGSPYVGNANPQPLDINVSRDSSFSTNRWDRYFELDSQGRPHLVWTDTAVGSINYVYWNGTNWSIAGGTVYNPATSNARVDIGGGDVPQLVLDSKNRPHITWHAGSWPNIDIFYIYWNGTNWVNANGITYNGANANVSNDSDSSTDPNLAVDSKDLPHIVWFNDSDRETYYIRFNGLNWVVQDNSIYNPATGNANISKNAGESNYPQIDLDSADIPGIVWDDDSGGNLDTYFVKLYPNQTYTANGSIYNGTNANVSNDSFSGIGQGAEIKFDNQNYPWVLWHANGDVYCVKWNGTAWAITNGSLYVPNSGNANITQNSGSSDCSTITFDANNYPHFTWHDTTYGNQEICYMKWDGTAFVNANNAVYSPTTGNVNVSNNTGSSYNPHLVLDDAGLPHLLWTDNTIGNNEIYYAHFSNSYDGSFTLTKSVDTNNDGDYSDSGKQVNVGDTLKYKINWKFNQGQDPLEEPYLYDTVPEGTHYVAGSATPNANLSYSLNGGATWIAGEPPNGSPAGTQLRWDLSSLWVGAAGNKYNGNTYPKPFDINVSSNPGDSWHPSICIDDKSYPCISWEDDTNGNEEIYFSRWNGSNWVNASGALLNQTNGNVSNNPGYSENPSIAINSSGNPCISWYDDTTGNDEVFYAQWNGSNWINASGIVLNTLNGNVSNNTGNWPSPIPIPDSPLCLKLDNSDKPCIAWHDNTTGNEEIYFTRWNGNNWVNASGILLNQTNGNVSNNLGTSRSPSLCIDSSGKPLIAWEDFDSPGNIEIFFTKWDGSNWVTASGSILNLTNGNISKTPRLSMKPSLAIDSLNNPHISWHDDSFSSGIFEVFYSKWDGNNWVNVQGVISTSPNCKVTNTNIAESWYPSLVLDSSNKPLITWWHTLPNREIHFTRWNGTNWVNTQSYVLLNKNGNISNNTEESWDPMIVLDLEKNPNIVWCNRISPSVFNSEIYYIKMLNNSDFTFSVQVDNPPTTPAFCNEATFRHKWDNGKATISNSVCNTIDYNFTGKFELKKSVEITGDGKYDDDGKEAKAGNKLNYKIDWSFDNPNSDPLFDAYVYDTIPEGTTYVAGSATTDMLSYSTDGGTTWITGEPPDGAPAGTKLRWGKIQSKWVDSKYFPLSKPNHPGNVSKTQNYSSGSPSITCNSLGFPCIAWNEAYLNVWDIYYIQWDGTKWVNVKNEPYPQYSANVSLNSSSSSKPSLCIDRNGYPCVSWHDNATGNWEIFFVRWDGKNWNNISNEIYNGMNANISNNLGDSLYSSLQIDTNNQPHISWYDNSYNNNNNEILYVKWNSTEWTNVNNTTYSGSNAIVSNNLGNSYLPCLRLDINNNPNLVWHDDTYGNYEVNFVKYNGINWVTINNYIYAGQNANISNTISDSSFAWLSLKSNGYPGIAWVEDPMNGEIYYINWNGMNWVTGSNQIYSGNNANISYSSYQSLNPRLSFDKNDQPCIVWCDAYYTPTPPIGSLINFSAQFIRWNGTRWVNANYQPYSSVQKGSIVKNNVFSFLLDLVIDKNNMPHVTWVDYFTNTEIMYTKFLTYTSFTFSVKITDPFTDYTKSPICNKAEFWHVFDKGNHTKSNNVCNSVYKKPEETKKAKLKITKKAFKYTLGPKDVVHFAVEIENIGDVDAIDVNIYDYFPKELEIYHSIPKGEINGSSIRYFLELLKAGHKRRFEVMFKVSKSAKIGKDGLYLTNIAKAFSKNSESAVEASATVVIRNDTPTGSVSMNLQMMGVDAKTGVCKKGTEISIKIDPEGGTPPYDIVVDWGDGTQSKAFNVTTDKPPTITHTYNEPGEYTITIICTDQYGNVCKIIRKVKVE